MPYYIFNQAGHCLASASGEPNMDDLEMREEIAIHDKRSLDITTLRCVDGVIRVQRNTRPASLLEQQTRLNALLKQAATTMAPLEDAEALGIISDTEREQLTAWQRYRVALYRLPQSEGWPAVVSWPEAPQ
jgi:hypothetical protein